MMNHKDHCGATYDVTQKQKFINNVEIDDSSAWQQYLMCLSSYYIIYITKRANSGFPDTLIMGEVTWLTWPQMTCMKNSRYTKCEYSVAWYFLKDSFSWEILFVIGSVAKLRHFVTVRRFTYTVIGKWPDLIWKWKVNNVRLERGISHAKFQPFTVNVSGGNREKTRLGLTPTLLGQRGLVLLVYLFGLRRQL